MHAPNATPPWQSALILLTNTVVGAVLVAFLYFGQMLLIPVVFAIFLTFLLAPCVRVLERCRLGRKLSVVLVTFFVTLVVGASMWLISVEVKSLADELPAYTENVKSKVRHLRELGKGSTWGRLEGMISDIGSEWHIKPGSPRPTDFQAAAPSTSPTPEQGEQAQVAVVQPAGQTWIGQLTAWLSPAMTPLSHIALALVLAIFMLLKREALRNRLIRLLGDDPMTTATKAVDDATDRVSRYLRMQFLVNTSYGFTWGLGLYLIGVNYFIFWAFLAAALRYIPYLGAPVAASLPIALSLAQFEGWWPTIGVLVFLLVLELASNNLLEPYLYGHSIGVSEVALLISSAFWALLWGPIGLLLAAPLTVCLVVMGKHVPKLNFLMVLLGDEPALAPDVRFYQRLVARDAVEAKRVIEEQLESQSLAEVYEQVVLPALVYAKRERDRDTLPDADEEAILKSIRSIVEELSALHSGDFAEELPVGPALTYQEAIPILAYPARDAEDRLALELLAHVLDPRKWNLRIAAPETLVAELLEDVGEHPTAIICIGSLVPGGMAQTRYVCRKLLARHPDIRVIVGRWGLKEGAEDTVEHLRDVGATAVGTTLTETANQIDSWLSILQVESEGEQERANVVGTAEASPPVNFEEDLSPK